MVASVGACRTQAPEEVLGSRTAPEDDWFCGAGADGEWECVQDQALVANPDSRQDKPVDKDTPASALEPDDPARADREPVLEWPAGHYAVQLIAMESEPAVAGLAHRLAIAGLLRARVESDGRLFHVLLVGPYAEQRDAVAAATSLVQRMPTLEPWVRSVGPLQEAVRRAQQGP